MQDPRSLQDTWGRLKFSTHHLFGLRIVSSEMSFVDVTEEIALPHRTTTCFALSLRLLAQMSSLRSARRYGRLSRAHFFVLLPHFSSLTHATQWLKGQQFTAKKHIEALVDKSMIYKQLDGTWLQNDVVDNDRSEKIREDRKRTRSDDRSSDHTKWQSKFKFRNSISVSPFTELFSHKKRAQNMAYPREVSSTLLSFAPSTTILLPFSYQERRHPLDADNGTGIHVVMENGCAAECLCVRYYRVGTHSSRGAKIAIASEWCFFD